MYTLHQKISELHGITSNYYMAVPWQCQRSKCCEATRSVICPLLGCVSCQICTETVNTQDLNKHLENRIPISSRPQHDSKQVSKPCQQNLDAIPKSFPKLSNSYNKTSKSNCNIKIGGCQGSQKHIPETMTNK